MCADNIMMNEAPPECLIKSVFMDCAFGINACIEIEDVYGDYSVWKFSV